MDFTDQVVIVTGGGGGIGRATALMFAERGAKVVVAGRNEDRLLDTVQLMGRYRENNGMSIPTDVRLDEAVRELVIRTLDRYERLDCLINNAGGTILRPLAKMEPADWHKGVRLNLDSVYLTMNAALPHLQKTGGTIVNVSSSAASSGFRWGGVYSAAKSGVEMLTRVAAAEFGPLGVRVNCVAPGMVASEGARRGWERGGLDLAAEQSEIPLRRVGEPREIAEVILFLASPAASFVTGAVIAADGGPRMPGPD